MIYRIKIIIILAILFNPVLITAQDLEKDANANFKSFNYSLALDQYSELYKKDTANSTINYRIGVSYLMLNIDKSKALPYILFAYNELKKPEVYLDLGLAYYYDHQFGKAIEILNNYKLKEKKNIEIANQYINYATNAKKLIKNPLDVSFINLGDYINSEKADYNPYLNTANDLIVFTSNRKYNSTFKTYVENIFFTRFNGNMWKRSRSVGSIINTEDDEILTGIAKNDEFIFVQLRRFDIYNDIYVTSMDGYKFKGIKSLGNNVNSRFVESGATLSITGDTLIFASDIDGGLGGLDLYMSFKLPDGTWGEPENLGSVINSEFDEDFPNFHINGKELYFASRGHNSMGGFDLFSSTCTNGNWKEPKNLGYPVNTVYDDNTISFTNNMRYAYKAAVRPEGLGDFDIYQLVFNQKEPVYTIFKGIINVSEGDSVYPVTRYFEDIELLVYQSGSGKLFGKYNIDNKFGEYVIALPPGRFELELSNDAFLQNQNTFSIPEMNSNEIVIRRNISVTFKKD